VLTNSGKMLVRRVKQEIKDCISEINFRSFLKPGLLIFVVYLLGACTIIRANFLYFDDIRRSVDGSRDWYNWSRYISDFMSIIVHGDYRLTDISPLPQLLAIALLSCSSVLLVYVLGNGKITAMRLLASVPLGLSPYFLECLSYKFDAPYMALSVAVCIIPFLFITRKGAFFFSSVVSLLIMCMSYQVSSGIYPLITVILCFKYWNNRSKSNKEILSFLGIAALAFGFSMAVYRIFFMIPHVDNYTSNTMLPFSSIIAGTLNNLKNYALNVNHDLGIIWKIFIALIMLLFVILSMRQSQRNKLFSLIVSLFVIGISFILSYGIYSVLENPLYAPRALLGFGVFLSILCIYIVLDKIKSAYIVALALNWCLFVFAFSYGNALADQARYAEFRITILLHDLSVLYPEADKDNLSIQLKNSIDFAPVVKNIAKHYPVIERLVPIRLGATGNDWNYRYFTDHFNYNPAYDLSIDFNSLNLPVVLDSYYQTIQSDGKRVLIILKH